MQTPATLAEEGGTLRATILGAHHVRLFKAAVTFLSKLGKKRREEKRAVRARVRASL